MKILVAAVTVLDPSEKYARLKLVAIYAMIFWIEARGLAEVLSSRLSYEKSSLKTACLSLICSIFALNISFLEELLSEKVSINFFLVLAPVCYKILLAKLKNDKENILWGARNSEQPQLT